MNVITIAIREQLQAALRDSALPLSTDQLAALTPPVNYSKPCDSWRHSPETRSPNTIEEVCLGDLHTVTRHRLGFEVYPHLRSMEKQGLCKRIRLDGHNRVYWQNTAEPTTELELLEDLWSRS